MKKSNNEQTTPTNSIVSVILSAFNAEKTINKCLLSLINQSYKDFEVICIDDGSSDNTLQILEDFNKKDRRIKVFTQKNSGVAFSRNRAINLAKGKYIMFCDADDTCEPSFIEDMVTTIEEQDVDLVMCDCNVIDLSNGKIQSQRYIDCCKINLLNKHNIDENNILKINVFNWSKIFKKELIDKYNITYPDKYEHDDTIFYYKYIINCSTYFGLNKKLYNYYVGNPNSITGKYVMQEDNGHQYDFVFAQQNLLDYLKIHENKYNDYMIKVMYCFFENFYGEIAPQFRQKAYEYFVLFARENKDILSKCKEYSKILKIKNFKKFDKYVNDKKRVSFFEKIFSIKNVYNNDKKIKIIRILGFKIKINLKK